MHTYRVDSAVQAQKPPRTMSSRRTSRYYPSPSCLLSVSALRSKLALSYLRLLLLRLLRTDDLGAAVHTLHQLVGAHFGRRLGAGAVLAVRLRVEGLVVRGRPLLLGLGVERIPRIDEALLLRLVLR